MQLPGKFSIGLFFLLAITPSFVLSPVTALEFTAQEFWFYIDKPQIINFSEMVFSVRNNNLEPIRINCTFKPIPQVNLSINFSWDSFVLGPNEKKINSYSIFADLSLSAIYEIKIGISQQAPNITGAIATVGGAIINYVVFYGPDEGEILDLRIVDQAETPRSASVSVNYRVNSSFSWTPINHFNGSRFYGIYPLGDYQVNAIDLETGIRGETTFTLVKNASIFYLPIPLIELYFDCFDIGSTIGVQFHIDNYKGELAELVVYAELWDGTEKLQTTQNVTLKPFPKTENQIIWINFYYDIDEGDYIVRGKLESLGFLLATYDRQLHFTPPNSPFHLTELALLVGIIALTCWSGYSLVVIIRSKLANKKRKLTNDKET